MNKKLQIKLNKISPTFKEYFEAKRIVENSEAKRVIENYEKQPKYEKVFYVRMSSDFYSVGTFGGFDECGNFMLKIEDVEPHLHIKDTHYIITEIEDVFEKKQKCMKRLHVGVE